MHTAKHIETSPVHFVADDEKKESLAAAFKVFSETSEQLSQSYRLLENKVSSLTREMDQLAAEKEEESREKNNLAYQMQALLDFLPGGVIVLDARGYVSQVNPAATELLEADILGKLWRKVIRDCFSPRNDDGLEVSTKTGKRISVATSSLNGNGQIILLTDQTETRELQRNLSRYEKLSAMGKMVSALAHQIRTPLSAALLYAGHTCNPEIDEEKRLLFSNKIKGRLQHMEKQVRDMMLFVKSELPLNELITTGELIEGLKEATEAALLIHSSECQWENDVPSLIIKCHREALISALSNLVNNALQACEISCHLVVKIGRERNDLITISICDNGPGIPENMLSEVQEMFVTTKSQGTGIGLAVVQAVARAHGGRFILNSIEGSGTCASMLIPQAENNLK